MKLKELATRHPWMKQAAAALLVLYWLNFTACVVGGSILGGNATNGKVEAGRYYVNYRGAYTEVSRGAYLYSQIHTKSLLYTLPLGILGCCFWYETKEDSKPEGKPNLAQGCFFMAAMILFLALCYWERAQ